MNPSESDFVVGGIRVNTFWTTTWNILRLWQCKESKSGRNEVTSKLDVAIIRTRNLCCSMCVQKRQASDDAGVAESFVLNQARKIWMLRCCDWCHSLPAFLVHPSEIWDFQHQITTPAAHHCKPWLLLVSWRMDKITAVHPLFLIYGPIGLESMVCQVPSRQRVFMKQLLGHRTRVTLGLSPRDWSEAELAKLLRWPCRDSSGFLNLHGNSTVLTASDLAAFEASIYCIEFCLICGICGQNWHKHNFCCALITIIYHQSVTDSIHLASFGKRSF